MNDNSENYEHKLSVIVVSRNEEKNIANCIESVLEATRGIDTEIILVDSSSEDKTIKIAKEFPIKIFQLAKDSQLSASAGRHVGFLNSSGKYIHFLDGDMTVGKTWISRAISFLEKADDSIAAVSGEISQTETASSYYKNFAKYLAKETKTEKAKDTTCLFGAFMIRANVLQKVGSFNPYLQAIEEGELSNRIYAEGLRIILLSCFSAVHHIRKQYYFMQILKKNLDHSISAGQNLRLSLFNNRFILRNLWIYKFFLLFTALTIFGIISIPVFFLLSLPQLLYLWLLCLILSFTFFMIREKGDIRSSICYFAGYSICSIFFLRGFFKTLKVAQEFPIKVKVIKS